MTDDFEVHVITNAPEAANAPATRGIAATAVPHALRGARGISSKRLMDSWKNTNSVISAMMQDAQAREEEQGLRLNEVSVSLSVTAEGDIGFVSGKAEAGITLKFTRR